MDNKTNMTKKEIKSKLEIAERQLFLNVYDEFNKWLSCLGFRAAEYTESSTFRDVNYWSDHIDSLYGVEHYKHDIVMLSVRFMRDRYKHCIYSIGTMQCSDAIPLEEFKSDLLQRVKEIKQDKLNQLHSVATL